MIKFEVREKCMKINYFLQIIEFIHQLAVLIWIHSSNIHVFTTLSRLKTINAKQNKVAAATACKQMYKQNGAEKRMWSKVEFSHKYLLTWAFFWKKKLFIWLPQLDELNGRTFFTFNFVLRPLHWPRQQISADLRFDECEFYTSVCRSFYICRKIKMPRIDLNGEQKFNDKFAKSNFSRGID